MRQRHDNWRGGWRWPNDHQLFNFMSLLNPIESVPDFKPDLPPLDFSDSQKLWEYVLGNLSVIKQNQKWTSERMIEVVHAVND